MIIKNGELCRQTRVSETATSNVTRDTCNDGLRRPPAGAISHCFSLISSFFTVFHCVLLCVFTVFHCLSLTQVTLAAGQKRTVVYVLHALVTSLNGTTDPKLMLAEAMARHSAAVADAPKLWGDHITAWDDRWKNGRIEIDGDLALAQVVNSSLYFLLSAIREDWAYGLSPGGLASSAYFGHVFWDMDTWMYPPLAVLHPELGRGCLAYRKARTGAAAVNAQAHGFQRDNVLQRDIVPLVKS